MSEILEHLSNLQGYVDSSIEEHNRAGEYWKCSDPCCSDYHERISFTLSQIADVLRFTYNLVSAMEKDSDDVTASFERTCTAVSQIEDRVRNDDSTKDEISELLPIILRVVNVFENVVDFVYFPLKCAANKQPTKESS